MTWPTRLVAWGASAGIVLGSPLVGELRQALLRTFPRHYVAILSTSVVLGAVVVLVFCARRIRDDRIRGYGAVASSLLLALISFAALRSGNPNVDAVEAFHFVEYGVLALLFFPFAQPGPRGDAYVQAALAAAVVAIADEWFQWFVPGRAGELHDVLFDCLAITCGLLLCLALDLRGRAAGGGASLDPHRETALSGGCGPSGPLHGTARSNSRRSLDPAIPRRAVQLGLHGAAVVLLLGGFVATVQLGHDIRDPRIGTFRSRFTGQRLLELAEDRRRVWVGGPPPVEGRYSREDQYLAEALWHVRRRNFGMDKDRKGDTTELDIAWNENRILEVYFLPVLEAPPAPGTTGHRLAPEQIAAVDAARAHGTAPFVSDAEAAPIYVWPPLWYWTGVGVAAAAVCGAGSWLGRVRRRREVT